MSEAGQLRKEIQHTRTELGETVQALAEKTDVRARIGHAAGEMATGVRDRARNAAQLMAEVGRQPVDSAAQVGQRVARTGRRLGGSALGWAVLGITAALGVRALARGRARPAFMPGRRRAGPARGRVMLVRLRRRR